MLALVRRRPSAAAAEPDVTYVERDLEQVETIRDLLAPGDAIVHLAARVHVMRDDDPDSESTYRRTNVEPTRMLCRSAVESGARRVIYLSSAKVFGEGADHCYQRTDVPAPADAYGRSKLEAEQVVRQLAGNGGVEWTILRPPFVYGPGGKGNFPRLVSLGYRSIIAGIALPNPASVRLHEGAGMSHVGTFPRVGYKHGRWIDVGYWVLTVGEGPPQAIASSSE